MFYSVYWIYELYFIWNYGINKDMIFHYGIRIEYLKYYFPLYSVDVECYS